MKPTIDYTHKKFKAELQWADRFLCGSSPAPSSSRSFHLTGLYPIICMQALGSLPGFIRHWSIETVRVRVSQGFSSLCKLDLPSATFRFIFRAYVWRRQEEKTGRGGFVRHTIFQADRSPIEVFHLHIQKVEVAERWAFENRGESVYRCSGRNCLNIDVSRGHQFIYLSCLGRWVRTPGGFLHG